MRLRNRNNLHLSGNGPATLVFAHGFGCDQNMWRLLAPRYADRYRVALFDFTGAGQSDLGSYDARKYETLQGHAHDLVEILDDIGAGGPLLLVGHSVAATIGVLADLAAPARIAAHLMIGPSPCYIDDGDYVGGFRRADIDALLETLDANYLGWSSSMAPVIMGAPDRPELGAELTNSFCRTRPDIASQFARATFLSDHRAAFERLQTPALIVQSSEDLIAPRAVGGWLHEHVAHSTLDVVENVGHCPHLSAPDACAAAIDAFLASLRQR